MSRFKDDNQDLQNKYQVNEGIKTDTVIVIGGKGENLGSMPKRQALAIADEEGMDLVQVGEKDSVAIARIMNFGKFIYEKKKQLGESKKHQKVIQVKELKLRPGIDEQDYKTKLKRAEEFFRDGKKVKFTIQFKGREVPKMDEFGSKMFARISQDLADRGFGLIVEEKDNKGGSVWSKIYFVKEK